MNGLSGLSFHTPVALGSGVLSAAVSASISSPFVPALICMKMEQDRDGSLLYPELIQNPSPGILLIYLLQPLGGSGSSASSTSS